MEKFLSLISELNAINIAIEFLNKQKNALRGQVEEIVIEEGGKIEGEFGRAYIQADSESVKYDAKKIEALIIELINEGHEDVAKRLASIKKIEKRSGGLRIVESKEK